MPLPLSCSEVPVFHLHLLPAAVKGCIAASILYTAIMSFVPETVPADIKLKKVPSLVDGTGYATTV